MACSPEFTVLSLIRYSKLSKTFSGKKSVNTGEDKTQSSKDLILIDHGAE